MIDTIGKELKALKVQSGLHFSIDKAIARHLGHQQTPSCSGDFQTGH